MADEPGQPPALTTLSLAEKAPGRSVEQKVTPFDVSGGVDEEGKLLAIDFAKIIRDFGAIPITPTLLERFEKVTGKKAHRFMRRGIVFSHRDLERLLDRYEKGESFYLYTGRGPSSDSMHVGHSIPFEFTKYLQDTFDCPLVIQLTDDEKFLHAKKHTIEDVERFARENAKDIIGIGFDPAKTFIFSDIDFFTSGYNGGFFRNVQKLAQYTTINSIQGTFGFDGSNNIGEYHFPAIQAATAFATSFPHIFGNDPLQVRKIPCLIPCAIDQDPYFRQCREHAEKLKYQKPALIHAIFLPALQGPGSKMSASVSTSAIFLGDTPNQIKNKVNKYAFSGGQDTIEKHRELGGRTKDDIAFQYLTFFLEDDAELESIRQRYESGEMLTGELKAICIKEVQQYVAGFQARRREVTEDVRKDFMTPRPLKWGGNPNKIEDSSRSVEEWKPGKKGKPKDPGEKSMAESHPAEPQDSTRKETVETMQETAPVNGHVRSASKRLSRSGKVTNP